MQQYFVSYQYRITDRNYVGNLTMNDDIVESDSYGAGLITELKDAIIDDIYSRHCDINKQQIHATLIFYNPLN